jgi:pimeloyl-ACP methyl ester carboxylesterase
MHLEAAALGSLLRTVGFERPILFGHSDGGSIALIRAATRPDEVAALVLEAPHVFVEPVTLAGIAEARTTFETTDLAGRLARYHRDPDQVFRRWSDIWLDPRFRTWNIEAGLDAIACPILLIQGEQDDYGTRAQLDAIHARAPQAEIKMLQPCGHSPHRDQPSAVLAAASDFLGRLSD